MGLEERHREVVLTKNYLKMPSPKRAARNGPPFVFLRHCFSVI